MKFKLTLHEINGNRFTITENYRESRNIDGYSILQDEILRDLYKRNNITLTEKQKLITNADEPKNFQRLFFHGKKLTKPLYKNFIFLVNYFPIWYYDKTKKPYKEEIYNELLLSSGRTKKYICKKIESLYLNSTLFDEGHYYTGDPIYNPKLETRIKSTVLSLIEMNKIMKLSSEGNFYED